MFSCCSLLLLLPKRAWRSGQCMSADEKMKNNVGVPTCVIIAFRSSFALCQYALAPLMFATYLDILLIKNLESLDSAMSFNSWSFR